MTVKIVIIIGVMLMWFTSMTVSTYAITNSTQNVNRPLAAQISDLRINPYFAPDESCDFNVQQLQCIPGQDQDCKNIEGFASNEDGLCHLPGDCPEGYHDEAEDESGQCYPDTEPCYPGQVRNQTNPNDKNCEEEDRSDTPDYNCLTAPGQEKCNALSITVGGVLGQCPDGFTTMSDANFTSSKCVPKNYEEARNDDRKREVYDKARCHPDYVLEVSESVDIWRTGGPIGSCKPID